MWVGLVLDKNNEMRLLWRSSLSQSSTNILLVVCICLLICISNTHSCAPQYRYHCPLSRLYPRIVLINWGGHIADICSSSAIISHSFLTRLWKLIYSPRYVICETICNMSQTSKTLHYLALFDCTSIHRNLHYGNASWNIPYLMYLIGIYIYISKAVRRNVSRHFYSQKQWLLRKWCLKRVFLLISIFLSPISWQFSNPIRIILISWWYFYF